MASDNKGILMIGVLAAAVGAAYLYFKNACAVPLVAGSSWPPPSICAMSLFTPTAVVPVVTAPVTTSTPVTGATTTTTSGSSGSASAPTYGTDPWQNAIALMKQTAGNDAQNFDGWSWQFQYQPRPANIALPTGYGQQGYITPTIMSAIIAAGGGDRTQVITAETFVGYLQSALSAAGLSGLGYEMPTWLFHRGVS